MIYLHVLFTHVFTPIFALYFCKFICYYFINLDLWGNFLK